MAVIEGQIEPLKKLKQTLHQNGITRFGSIAEINDFLKNYDREINQIPKEIEKELDEEISQLKIDLAQYQQDYEALKADVTGETSAAIKKIEIELNVAKQQRDKSVFHKIFSYPKVKRLDKKKANLEQNFESIVSEKTYHAEHEVSSTQAKLHDYAINRDAHISERSAKSSQELEDTKVVIDSLYNLIAGAIGENAVMREVQKLPDSFHLFNDFSVEFDPPIYNKKEDDRIYSIQVDHLLVSEAGIFILETKNWGKQSLKSIDLRSPVKQIRRSSYALFVLLNSRSRHNINLERHHWGRKQIPIKNLIVMTGAKPKEEFNHVKVLSLKELNGYVTYFEPVFNSDEIESLCDYLRKRMS